MSYVLIIAGSQDLVVTSRQISAALEASNWGPPSVVVCGMARGPDLAGKEWAEEHGITVIKMPAPWRDASGQFNRAAGIERNGEMARIADRLLAFWDGTSPGTRNMIHRMRLRKSITIVR